jgi:hypothetical protein
MKKIVILMAVFWLLPIFAFAHDGHGHGKNHYKDYSVCYYSSCYEQDVHFHGGIHYAPHFFNDGHTYHQQCQIDSCHNNAVHTHNGNRYFPNYRH